MSKGTRTYWNPLSDEHRGEWETVPGLEGAAEQLTLAIDEAAGDYTRLTRFHPGADTTPFGGKSHDYPEEVFIIEGRLYDTAFDRWLDKGDYASRPPGEAHGPFRTEEGCLVLEMSYPSQAVGARGDVDDAKQRAVDAEHLKLLRWGYFISAATTALFSLTGLAYAGVAAVLALIPSTQGQSAPPQQVLWLFGGIGIAITLLMVALALAKLRVAKALRERSSRTLCTVIAVITMFGMPYGTLLGIATLLVLSRPSVARAFGASRQ